MPDSRADQIAKLRQSIAAFEEQERVLNTDLSTALQPWRDLLSQLEQAEAAATLSGSGTLVQGADNVTANTSGIAVGGDVHGPVASGDDNTVAGGHVIIAEEGATVVVGELPVKMTAVDRASALGRYLQRNQLAAPLFQASL